MSVIEALILGIVQGLTEFLPVSSSGHLILTQRLMGLDSTNLTFSLALHIATMAALLIAMRKKLWAQIKKPFNKLNGMILAATAMTALVVLVVKDVATHSFDGSLLPFFFLITALLLTVTGLIKREKPLTYTDALIVGFIQGLAVFPGLSRSGSTIATARICGVNAKESTDFSFFISIPIIIGSALIDCLGGGFTGVELLPLAVGFFAAFFTGLFAVKFMLRYLTKNFDVFSVYLLILSLFLFVNDFWLRLF